MHGQNHIKYLFLLYISKEIRLKRDEIQYSRYVNIATEVIA